MGWVGWVGWMAGWFWFVSPFVWLVVVVVVVVVAAVVVVVVVVVSRSVTIPLAQKCQLVLK